MKRFAAAILALCMGFGVLPFSGLAFDREIQEVENLVSARTTLQGTDPAEPLDYDTDFYNAQSMTRYDEEEALEVQADFDYVPMTTSQDMIDILKDMEGFSPTPYWDYLHYSIGYGSGCGASKEEVPAEYWDGISEEKGEELLRAHLSAFENSVNKLCKKIGYQPTQQQFDAMLDFTYALGDAWTTGSMLRTYLEQRNTSEIDLVRAMGAWCRVSGSVRFTTASRRIREAIIFLYGEYYQAHGQFDYVTLPVKKDNDLPYFKMVIYYGNGAYMVNQREDDVNYYVVGQPYGKLPTPTLEGYTISGWLKPDGTYLKASDICTENIRNAQAQWAEGALPIPEDLTNPYENGIPFTDVPVDAWYFEDVKFAFEQDLVHGVSERLFDPESPMTRAMAVQILYNMAGADYTGELNAFDDVAAEAWYAKAVCWASANGIVLGVSERMFAPEQVLQRQELMTLLYRYFTNYMGNMPDAGTDLSVFPDADQISDYAITSVSWVVASEIIKGYEDGTIRPADQVTRAQAAAIFRRFMKNFILVE